MSSTRKTTATVAPRAGRLTARSVIASTLLGVEPPMLPTRSLVATAEILGIAPGTARVAMSRMVAAGELDPVDDGYRLAAGPLLARQARQGLSRTGSDQPWDGGWCVAVATGESRDAMARADLRAATAALRFGSLRDGVWLRPANLPDGVLTDAETRVADQCTSLDARPDDPAELVGRLWDLDAWAERATDLLDALAQLQRDLERDGPGALAAGFVGSAAVLRHFQADPLLPLDLLPPAWPGPALRAAHRHYDEDFKQTLAAWQRSLLR